ncbi:MAG: T9SS type A sorting domain-containing protein [Candidatus Krumholzibacteria bacterium]|nr:T9SS type A sorting domain-containing protein [Candidatus Krumholzibacteria bacterium]
MRLLFLCLLFPVFALAAVGFGVSAPGTVDTRPPEIVLHFPSPGDTLRFETDFQWSIVEDSISLSLDAMTLRIYELPSDLLWEQQMPMSTDGEYSVHWTILSSFGSGRWEVTARDAFGNVSVAERLLGGGTDTPESLAIPASLTLGNAWPNPFNPTTQLRFSIPESGPVSLEIYDLSGRHVESLFRGTLERGWQEFLWKAEGQASGVYLALLKTNTEIRSTKLVLLK